jgi:hypothetical protein
MLESESKTIATVLELADEHRREVERCLTVYFKRSEIQAREAVRGVVERLHAIETSNSNRLHSLFVYHFDPFDIAAAIARVNPGTSDYEEKIKAYRKSES